jgi:hypothetical protein
MPEYNLMEVFSVVVAVAAIFISILSIYQSKRALRFGEKTIISKETQNIYDLWFSVDFKIIRERYKEIIAGKKSIPDWQKKEWEQVFTTEESTDIMKLLYFFDKVGWLANTDLINKNYMLAPMHKWVIDVWNDLECFVLKARKSKDDIVFNMGFAELAKYAKGKPLKEIIAEIYK